MATAQGSTPDLRDGVIGALRTVFDPEIPVNIYDLGLIYDIDISETGQVTLTMTFTSPMCPVAEILPPEIQMKVKQVPGVSDAEIRLVWDPPWDPSRMTEAARLELGM